ncbi:MAG TPA: autotransporter outer membrane beta-barrel domain-containing protein, partial [Amaricoccus sp.]|uniref:autotransporter outer membrane beta-barrel domain-containing protein n=1 Tax=Amaricoccus sp. TaxID=1872485 RepID=UPI002B89AC65
GDGGGGDGGGGDGGGGDGGGGDGGDGGGGDGGDGGGGDGGGGDGGGGGGGDGGGGSGGGGTGGGGGGDGGGGDGGGGTGGGGGSAAGPKTDRGTEQAVTGSGALPVFTDPYTITERLVGWGFGAPGGTPVTPTPDGKERRGWFQGRSSTFDFDGSGRDSGGHRNEAIVGFDVVRRPDLVYGLAAGWEDGHADSFGGQVDSRFDGYFFGPYVGWKPDPDLVLDLWVGYARRDFSNSIAGFDSDFDVNRVFVSANATGRYLRGDYELRPKLELFYANDDIPDHSYSNGGSRFGVVGGHDDEMVSTLSGEVRREHVTSGGTRIAPYFRVGIDAWLARPNDGLLLDGDLNEFSMSAITGDLRAGVNAAFLNGGRFDARVGYGGIGEDGLEIVEGEIALSIPF